MTAYGHIPFSRSTGVPHVAKWLVRGSLVAAFVSMACHLFASFDVQQTGTVEIPANQTPETLEFQGLTTINLSDNGTLREQGVDVDDIHAASLQNVTLAVTQPATGVDLTFIKTLDVIATADNLAPLAVAHFDTPQVGSNLVSLHTDPNVSLVPYLKSKHLTLSGQASFNQAPTQDLTVVLTGSFRLTVGEPAAACGK